MENREGEIQKPVSLPEGAIVLADLGYNVLVVKCDINLLREQDKNAHLMKPEMFRQLHENIKGRGGLESLPFCALTDKIEVVSGHHRLRAAKEAGLKEIIILLDVSGLTRSQIAAKQLAHNAINGFDDPSMLKEIAKMITDVDDLIESYIGKDILGEPLAELDKLLSPMIDFDFKQIQFMFLPHQIKDLQELVKKTASGTEFIGVAYIDQYKQLIDTMQKYQTFKNVKNIGSAIHCMVDVANREMEGAGFDGEADWGSVNHLFGASAVPRETVDIVKRAMEKMKKEGSLNEHNKWKALHLLSQFYLDEV